MLLGSMIDCAQSKSFKPEDKDRVFEVIQRTIGFPGLNSMVLGFMERWIDSSLFLKMKGNKESRELCLDAMLLLCFQARELRIEKIGREHSDIIRSSKILACIYKAKKNRDFLDFLICRENEALTKYAETLKFDLATILLTTMADVKGAEENLRYD